MKKTIYLVSFLLAGLSPVLAQAHQNFTLVNKTGLSIDQLFVSPTDVKDWQENVLDVDILAANEECDVSFHPGEETCLWDLKIIDAEGDAIEWDDIDLCKAYTVTVHWQDGKAWVDLDDNEQAGGEQGGSE